MVLRDAVMTLLRNVSAGRFKILSPPGSPQPVETQMPHRGTGYPLHSHTYPELVQAIDGKSRLKLGRDALELNTRTAYLIQPGTVHCETFYNARCSYRLLWTVFSPAGVNMFVSQYSHVGGFGGLSDRLIGLTMNIQKLWTLTTGSNLATDVLSRAHFQALKIELLLDTLTRMDKATATTVDHKKALVDQICGYIEHHYREEISIDDLAQMARCTPNYLNSLFRKNVGQPIHQFILRRRLEVAREWLGMGDKPVKKIAFELGFRDPLYFSRLFKKRFGKSPGDFRVPSRDE